MLGLPGGKEGWTFMTPFKERGGLVKALGSRVKIAADGEVGVNTLGDGYFVADIIEEIIE